MVTKRKSLIIIGAAVALLFVATAATIVFAETYNMTGTISAIDLQYQTMVIKYPLASKQNIYRRRAAGGECCTDHQKQKGQSE